MDIARHATEHHTRARAALARVGIAELRVVETRCFTHRLNKSDTVTKATATLSDTFKAGIWTTSLEEGKRTSQKRGRKATPRRAGAASASQTTPARPTKQNRLDRIATGGATAQASPAAAALSELQKELRTASLDETATSATATAPLEQAQRADEDVTMGVADAAAAAAPDAAPTPPADGAAASSLRE